MAQAGLRRKASWSETLLHPVDLVLERLEYAIVALLTDKHADFRDEVQVMRLRRLAAQGCNGQALI